MDLNHLNLRVRDAAQCRDFYVEHFEFEPAFEADGGYFIRNADGFLLALIPASEHAALPDGFHIGFGLESAAHVQAKRTALERAGVTLGDLLVSEDYVSVRCWDPDGTEIELFWEP